MAPQRTIDIASVIERQKLTPFIVGVVTVSWIVTFFDGFDMMILSFTAPYIAEQMQLDKLALGNLFSIGIFGIMLGGFLFGYLGDRLGRRPAVIAAVAGFGIFTTAFAFARDYQTLLLLRFLNGVVIGGMLPLCWTLNIEFVPKNYRATVVTVIMIGYTMGTSMAGPVTVALAPSHGWQAVFIAGGIGSLLAAALLFFTFPESIRYLTSRNKRPDLVAGYLNKLDPTLGASPADAFIAADEEKSKAVKFKVARLFDGELRWITPFLWLAYIASSMAIFFGSSWGPLVFEYIGFSRDTAALFSSVNSIGGAVGGLLLMRFTDRLGAISIVAPALVALPLLLIQGFGLVSGGTFLFVHFLGTMAMGAVHFGLHSIAGVFYPSAYRANGAGWTTSVAKIGSIAGPLIGGMVLSTDLPVLRTFALMAICPAMVVACIFVVGRMHSRIIRRERADAATAPAAA